MIKQYVKGLGVVAVGLGQRYTYIDTLSTTVYRTLPGLTNL